MLHVFRDAMLIAGKDLRIEARARVVLNQVLPLALLTIALFAFALDPDTGVLSEATPGLYWVAVLFGALFAIQRAFALEAADGNRDGLRLSGLEPGSVFLGKVAGICLQMLVLEAVLFAAVVVLYGADPLAPSETAGSIVLLVTTCLTATVGIAGAGSLYGILAAGLRVRETLLPLLLLPVVAPVLIAGTRAFEAAFDGDLASGWPWLGLLGAFAAVYIVFGVVAYGPLLEET